MPHYIKTTLGHQALSQSIYRLTAQQRRALILLESTQFQQLSPQQQRHLISTDVLQALISQQLVCLKKSASARAIQPVKIAPTLALLNFKQVQQMMIASLEQHCGLLAKPILKQIAFADSVPKLQTCQIKWLTLLQESRMSADDLQQALQQINLSLEKLK